MGLENKKLEALNEHKKGLMQKLFPKEGETTPQFRFPEFAGAGEWEEKALGDVGEIITGKTPSTSDESLWNGTIQFVTPTDISETKYQFKTQRTIVKSKSIKILPPNSIMYTCIASIGKMAMSIFPCSTNQQINSLVPFSEYNNDFIYYWLLHITPNIKSGVANNTLPIINKTEFSNFKILIPLDKKEQQKIADCLSSIDETIKAQSQKIEALKAHKKGLMQKLFPKIDGAV